MTTEKRERIRNLIICRCILCYMQYMVFPADICSLNGVQVYLEIRYQLPVDIEHMLLYFLVTCTKYIVTIAFLGNVLNDAFKPGKYIFFFRYGIEKTYLKKYIEQLGVLFIAETAECILIGLLLNMAHVKITYSWNQVPPFIFSEITVILSMVCMVMMADLLLSYVSLKYSCIIIALVICSLGYWECTRNTLFPPGLLFWSFSRVPGMTEKIWLLAFVSILCGIIYACCISLKKRIDFK